MNWRKMITAAYLAIFVAALWGIGPPAAQAVDESKVPHYFGPYPNWALSPLPTVNPDGSISGGIRKFVDGLPKLGPDGANNLGQYLPVAVPDTTTYPGSDYYEIGVVQYRQKMHSDLPATLLRGYVQLSTTNVPGARVALSNALMDGSSAATGYTGVTDPHYLGPIIVATKDKPVRILFRNLLPSGVAGDLFLPVDSTLMGSGMGQMNEPYSPAPVAGGDVLDAVRNPMCSDSPKMTDRCFADNRATLHLHGGITPWISDGTPHQWVTPADQATPWPKGVSVRNVPDMPDPGPGAMTFFYTNQQSARLMFYHDHSWGITRLNVYAGEAAGYLITDDTEKALVDSGTIPGPADTIPLIVQDRTFVPQGNKTARTGQLYDQDPTWDENRWGGLGNLWYHHVYMPAQNPGDASGMSAFGRWMYGPWFWPPAKDTKYGAIKNPRYNMDPATSFTTPLAKPCNVDDPTSWQYQSDPFCEPEQIPGTPNISAGMEQFNDTPVVNGTAYPTTAVDPKPYRLRILNAANDRFFNLQWYVADATGTEVALKAAEVAAAQNDPNVFPTPDTTLSAAGPSWIQIGSEGGFLPSPVVIPNQPITWITDPTRFDFGNVDKHSLVLAPAERADVVVDFSQFAGKTLILYNDAPAAYPARVASYDYYTGAPDLSPVGAPGVLPGYGPNTRTVMQIKVGTGSGASFDLGKLQAAFQHKTDGSGVFESGQHPIIVGQAAYNSAYGTTFPSNSWCNAPGSTRTSCDGFARILEQGGDLFGFNTLSNPTAKMQIPLQPKALHDEMNASTFDEFGRMQANMGVESVPATPGMTNLNLMSYVFPPTEIIDGTALPAGMTATAIGSSNDGTQIWKITHNGVDTHPIHFHLYDVQVLNRVTWDNIVIPPDANELGWKDTVRISPLEDTIVALRPVLPVLPFDLPNSIRLLNPLLADGAPIALASVADALGVGIPPSNPDGEPVDIYNHKVNFGAEYVWHCHILSHEEMDMMRPVAVALPPVAPSGVTVAMNSNGATVSWIDNSQSETGFEVQRGTSTSGPWTTVATIDSSTGPQTGGTVSYLDPQGSIVDSYRVRAVNVVGDTWNYADPGTNELVSGGFPTVTAVSAFSTGSVPAQTPAAPGTVTAALQAGPQIALSWVDNATNETGFVVERSVNGGSYATLTTAAANATTYTDSTVLPGTSYSYRVAASYSGILSAYGISATVTVPPVPVAPGNLAGTLQAGPQIALTWSDNSGNETGFVLQRSENGGAFQTVATPGANVTSYTDTPVTSGSSYRYQIAAQNGSGTSSYAVSAAITVPPPPAAPSNMVATLQAGPQVALSWRDNSSNETGFVIQRSFNGGVFENLATVGANIVSYIDRPTLTGSYRYQVAAANGVVLSSFAVSVVVNVTIVPAAPTSLTAVLQAGPQISLAWRDNSGNETGFQIQRSENGGAFTNLATVGVNVTTYLDGTVIGGRSYGYRVAAVNGPAASAYATSATVTVPVPPAPPSNVGAVLQVGPKVALTWTDNSTNETGFAIQRSINGGAFAALATVAANVKSYTDATVVPGNSYSYQVASNNGPVITSAYAASPVVTLPTAPAAPSNLTATQSGALQTTLTWTDNSGNETGFQILRSENAGAYLPLVTTGPNVTTYTDNTVIAGRAYRYQVAAVNGIISSAYAVSGSVTVRLTAPAAPSGMTATAAQVTTTTDRVTLSWTDNSVNETGFQLVRASDAAFTSGVVTTNLAANLTTYSVNNLPRNATYYFRLRAINAAGTSAWTNATPAPITTP
jgi:FtsP/CotA-like multicopper oxidase with cupredoxin domain